MQLIAQCVLYQLFFPFMTIFWLILFILWSILYGTQYFIFHDHHHVRLKKVFWPVLVRAVAALNL